MNKPVANSNEGFSLVEIMIATGILALALLGIMKAATTNSSTNASQSMDLDFAILQSNIQTALTSSCTSMLGGGVIAFASNVPSPNPSINQLTVGGVPIPGAAYPVPMPNGHLPPGISITQIALTQTPINLGQDSITKEVEYKTNLNIQAKKITPNGTPLPGNPTFSKDFPVTVWVDNASQTITRCETFEAPANAILSLTPTSCQIEASWSVSNPSSVSQAQILSTDGSGTTIPLSASPSPSSTFISIGTSGTYSYILLLTDSNGVQTYGMASPSPSAVTVTCP